jgi:hypothetical protein
VRLVTLAGGLAVMRFSSARQGGKSLLATPIDEAAGNRVVDHTFLRLRWRYWSATTAATITVPLIISW